MTTETIAPAMVRFPLAGLSCSAGSSSDWAAALVTMAIVILAFHAAPVHKKIFSVVDYTAKPPFGLGLDHQWLGFFQYETGAVFTTLRRRPARSVSAIRRRVRTGEGLRSARRWLIEHQDARPYGEGSVQSEQRKRPPRRRCRRRRSEGRSAGHGKGRGTRGPTLTSRSPRSGVSGTLDPACIHEMRADSPLTARFRAAGLGVGTQLDQLEPGPRRLAVVCWICIR